MFNPPEGDITLRFMGDDQGSEGSAARWTARAVIDSGNRVSYTEVPVSDGEGEVTITMSGTEDNLYLVVAVSSPRWNEGETFNYQYQFDAPEGAGTSGGSGGDSTGAAPSGPTAYQPSDKGGGCSHSPSRSIGWTVLLLALLVRGRQDGGR